ncbi:MAG: thioredoxin domain-containing protein [Clostridiales bacterium]|nr:thioredoxin domain-containing protein [Clostridiales bacterium]
MSNDRKPNRLVREKSPYLLQHASNPVNWYPWCDEAFETAREEDKPIFLSIGYSTCHWCHVMEREVFEKQDAAALLNEHFISIKVDREERPDVDHIYMDACQAMTGSGGWPLTIFMTPDKKPFFAGTYFPLAQFKSLISNILDIWTNKRHDIINASDRITRHIASQSDIKEPSAAQLNDTAAKKAFAQLGRAFDREYGGFGAAPKFPSPHTLMFLKRYALCFNDKEASDMADYTLTRMFLGGLFDHIGGGFCRYSTDREYLVPHFEKMLYDNAMLTIAYAEAGMHDIAERTLEFCIRDLLAPEGAFYTAFDADSEGVEGKYYLFTPKEVEHVLGGADAKRFCTLYNITKFGNFEHSNIPNLIKTGILTDEDEAFSARCREQLYHERRKRVPPARDEKFLLSSNSLMISALATAGRLMNEKKYVTLALSVTDFIRDNMMKGNRLYAVYRDGLLRHLATSDDYAYFAWALYRLHQATLDDTWLSLCITVCDSMMALFADDDGLLWLSGNDVTDLPVKSKNTYDGALPSGNSIAAGVFLRVYTLTNAEKYKNAYDKIVSALAGEINAVPRAHTALLSAALLDMSGGVKVELPRNNAQLRSIIRKFHPFAVYKENAEHNDAMVCIVDRCLPPISDLDTLTSAIEQTRVFS